MLKIGSSFTLSIETAILLKEIARDLDTSMSSIVEHALRFELWALINGKIKPEELKVTK